MWGVFTVEVTGPDTRMFSLEGVRGSSGQLLDSLAVGMVEFRSSNICWVSALFKASDIPSCLLASLGEPLRDFQGSTQTS